MRVTHDVAWPPPCPWGVEPAGEALHPGIREGSGKGRHVRAPGVQKPKTELALQVSGRPLPVAQPAPPLPPLPRGTCFHPQRGNALPCQLGHSPGNKLRLRGVPGKQREALPPQLRGEKGSLELGAGRPHLSPVSWGDAAQLALRSPPTRIAGPRPQNWGCSALPAQKPAHGEGTTHTGLG